MDTSCLIRLVSTMQYRTSFLWINSPQRSSFSLSPPYLNPLNSPSRLNPSLLQFHFLLSPSIPKLTHLGHQTGTVCSEGLKVLLLGGLCLFLVHILVICVQGVPHRGHNLRHFPERGIGARTLNGGLCVSEEQGVGRDRPANVMLL